MAKLPGTFAASIVGHMPLELSCFIWYAIERGAQITATLVSTQAKVPFPSPSPSPSSPLSTRWTGNTGYHKS